MADRVLINGEKAEIISESRGWIKVKINGKEQSFRHKDITKIKGTSLNFQPTIKSYIRGTEVTVSGCRVFDINDKAAEMLRGLNFEAMVDTTANFMNANWEFTPESEKKILGDCTCDDIYDHLRIKYDHLNPGMQRMNLGNKIRKTMKNMQEG